MGSEGISGCGLVAVSVCGLEDISGHVPQGYQQVIWRASVGVVWRVLGVWSEGHQWSCSSRLSAGNLESISWCSLEKVSAWVWRVLVGVVWRASVGVVWRASVGVVWRASVGVV